MSQQERSEANIALDIMERSPLVAMRVTGKNGEWETRFITGNVGRFGYTQSDFLSGKIGWANLVHPDDMEELCRRLDELEESGGTTCNLQYRVVAKNGEVVWVGETANLVRDENGRVVATDCTIQDQTEIVKVRARMEDNLRQHQAMNEILHTLQDSGIEHAFQLILDKAGDYLGISRVVMYEDDYSQAGARAVYQWCAGGVPALPEGYALSYEADLPEAAQTLRERNFFIADSGSVPKGCAARFAAEGKLASAVFTIYLNEQRYGFLSFDECAQPRKWQEETLIFLHNVARAVSTALMRRQNEEANRRMAYMDQLTGLTNRYHFDMNLGQAIRDARAEGTEGYVLFINMDDFKVINDGYGHDYGDSLLVEVAAFLTKQFAGTAEAYRFCGDEFLMLLRGGPGGLDGPGSQSEKMQWVVDEIMERARHPWQVRDKEVYCTISIGAVKFPNGDEGVTEVVRNADIAMHQAKQHGKDNFAIYNPSLEGRSRERVEMERKLRAAVDDNLNGFEVYYQPLVNMSGDVIGSEALMRWRDPEGNMVSPGEFIPLAEYLGLIVPLGEFIMREAAAQCRRINEQFPRYFMSINVSMRQFQQPDILERIESILTESGVDFTNIVLEVTEGMVVDDLGTMRRLIGELRMMGMKTAMDDFGTGYSSLNNMRELPLDIIKIDRTFVRDITNDAYSKSFIRLITDLSHSMGRAVCVEGVETIAQYRYCAEYGVDYLQGFYFHRPMTRASLETLLLQEILTEDVKPQGA